MGKICGDGGPGQSPDASDGQDLWRWWPGARVLTQAMGKICGDGGPGQSPTADLRVRSALLYATELPGHCS